MSILTILFTILAMCGIAFARVMLIHAKECAISRERREDWAAAHPHDND